MLLDRDQLLLTDEAVPATKRLRVERGIGVVSGHILAHDLRGVARDVEPGLEAVLQTHARNRFRIDAIPGLGGFDSAVSLCNLI